MEIMFCTYLYTLFNVTYMPYTVSTLVTSDVMYIMSAMSIIRLQCAINYNNIVLRFID